MFCYLGHWSCGEDRRGVSRARGAACVPGF